MILGAFWLFRQRGGGNGLGLALVGPDVLADHGMCDVCGGEELLAFAVKDGPAKHSSGDAGDEVGDVLGGSEGRHDVFEGAVAGAFATEAGLAGLRGGLEAAGVGREAELEGLEGLVWSGLGECFRHGFSPYVRILGKAGASRQILAGFRCARWGLDLISIVRVLGLIGSKFGEDFLGSGRMPLRRRKIEVGEVGGSGQEEQRQEQGWHLSLLPFQKKGG